MFIRFCFGSWGWGRSLAVSRWSLGAYNVDQPAQERKEKTITKEIGKLSPPFKKRKGGPAASFAVSDYVRATLTLGSMSVMAMFRQLT